MLKSTKPEQAPVISVIVPVYNTQDYLPQCLDSLLQQTINSLEIIIVNDASPDQSAAIIAHYQTTFADRIRVIEHSTNNGLATARNTGLTVASGEYIGFVDSDDYVESTMYESMLRAAWQQDADVVICEMALESEQGQTKLSFESHVENTSACNKLFRRSLIEHANLQFAQGHLFEDEVFVLQALMKANRIVETGKLGYIYRSNPNGICRSPNQDSQRLFARMRMQAHLLEQLQLEQLPTQHQQLVLLSLCRHAMLQLNTKVHWYQLRGYWLFTKHLLQRYKLDVHFDSLSDDYFAQRFQLGCGQLMRLWLWQQAQRFRRLSTRLTSWAG